MPSMAGIRGTTPVAMMVWSKSREVGRGGRGAEADVDVEGVEARA